MIGGVIFGIICGRTDVFLCRNTKSTEKTKSIIPQTDVITHQRLDELEQKLKDLTPLFVEDVMILQKFNQR